MRKQSQQRKHRQPKRSPSKGRAWQEEYQRASNRARFLEEVTFSLRELLNASGKTRSWLASKLGVSAPYVTKILEGSNNFTLETLADIGRVFGRASHVVWGIDLDEMRMPVDEAQAAGHTTTRPVATAYGPFTHGQFAAGTVISHAHASVPSQMPVPSDGCEVA